MGDIQVEQLVTMPIKNPDTGAASRTFIFAGKVDWMKRSEGKVRDYKGTADSAQYITEKRIGFQAECYALAMDYHGIPITQIEYCLVRRPSIRFCGKDKDAEAYEERCLQQYFDEAKRMVTHTLFVSDTRLGQARLWLWENTKRLLECEKCNRWLPCEHACYAWHRECEFLPLCEMMAATGSCQALREEDYEEAEVNPELPVFDSKGKRVLTYSALSLLALCEVRYFWKHHERLRKRREAHSEPLWLGSAMHRGLEVWADDGLGAALDAIDEWAAANPVLGPDAAHKQKQETAKARAMCRAAAAKWGNINGDAT
jgi:hypothetical protein